MDYWPQKIFLAGNGKKTVGDFIYEVASKYAKTQIPKTLDSVIIEELLLLVNKERLMAFSDTPFDLENNLLHPKTEEGEIDLVGHWQGSYDYDLPEEYKDEKTQNVNFIIDITETTGVQFSGTVEDDLSTGGTPGRGEIKGDYDNYIVKFEKLMPISAKIDINGNHVINENKKHKTLIYKGEFSRDKKSISGTWRFKKKVLTWRGIIPFWGIPGSGRFTMTKNKPTI